MRIKFRDGLILIFFGINLSLILFLTRFSYNNLEESVLKKTRDQLLSINILKKRHIEYYLENKVSELEHFIRYAESHNSTVKDRVDMLLDVEEVAGVAIDTGEWVVSKKYFQDFTERSYEPFPPKDSLLVFLSAKGHHPTFLHFYFLRRASKIHVFLTKDGLKDIVLERSGMGATGESYLVSLNRKMQTPSRFFPDSIPENIPVHTVGVERSFDGETGTGVYKDYRAIDIMGAYRNIMFHNLEMALLTEIDLEEALQEAFSLRRIYLFLTITLIIVSLAISVTIAKFLTRPISSLKQKTGLLSKGILPEKFHSKSLIKEMNDINLSINHLINSLRHTVLFAREIGHENFDADYQPLSDKDELGSAILEMRNKLIVLNQQKQQLELQRKKDLLNTQEKERERIARDIHDGIGPLLTTTKMKISSLKIDDHDKKELVELLENTLKEIRSVSRNLMPGVLIDFGPAEAIAGMVEEIKKRTGVNVSFQRDLSAEQSKFGKEEGIALFRIAQEAINNALKHAQATEIKVTLTEFDEYTSLFIKDNGKGFDKKIIESSEGKGLRNIEERVNILGGDLYIESGEKGTTIEIEIPRS